MALYSFFRFLFRRQLLISGAPPSLCIGKRLIDTIIITAVRITDFWLVCVWSHIGKKTELLLYDVNLLVLLWDILFLFFFFSFQLSEGRMRECTTVGGRSYDGNDTNYTPFPQSWRPQLPPAGERRAIVQVTIIIAPAVCMNVVVE